MIHKPVLLLVSCIIISCVSPMAPVKSRALSGPYPGQSPPGDEPVLFAPGIISDGFNNRDMAMMPDGSDIYWIDAGIIEKLRSKSVWGPTRTTN